MRLEVSGVSKSFGELKALDGVSFEAPEGKLVSILGPSGSGKTTLLRCVAGVETPDSGVIRIGEEAVYDAGSRVDLPPEKRGVGMVFQSYALWPHMTVAENVAYPLRIRKDPEMVAKVNAVLETMGLTSTAKRYPYQVSGGEQQRIAIARAIVYSPKVVLFDEPFSNLDLPLKEALRDELRRLQRSLGLTMVYVTHDQVDALSLGDLLMIVDRGRRMAFGDPVSLVDSPQNSYTARFLGGMLVLDADATPAGGGVHLETSAGRLTLGGRVAKAGRTKLCVRPSGLSMAAEGELEGIVTGTVRKPDGRAAVRVTIGEGSAEVGVARGSPEPPVGARVQVKVSPEACLLMDQ